MSNVELQEKRKEFRVNRKHPSVGNSLAQMMICGYADGYLKGKHSHENKELVRRDVNDVRATLESITAQLCEKYPAITIDDILGEPRLAGTRFAVSNVLTALTLDNSFEEVIDNYDDRYTEDQLKDAVKFARDFLDCFYRP